MSSARSRKFRNDFYDRIYRAEVAKNPRLAEERLEEAKQEHMQGMMRFFNELPNQQAVLRERGERLADRRLMIDGVEYRFIGANNSHLGDEVWNYAAPQRERNEAPQWEVNFTPDPTVRFETPVAPKEPDICEIINLDD